MASRIMVGDTTTGDGGLAAGVLSYYRVAALYSGFIRTITLRSSGTGNVKYAVRADNSGSPGTLITAQSTGQPITSGTWTAVTLPVPVFVYAGQYVWIGVVGDVSGVTRWDTSGGSRRYKTVTYSTFTFSASVETGLSSDSKDLAGYGSDDFDTEGVPLVCAATISNLAASMFYNLHFVTRCPTIGSGKIKRMYVHGGSAGLVNIKFNIYADSGGSPGARLYAYDVGTSLPADTWTMIDITDFGGVLGQAYWVGFVNSTEGVVYTNAAGTSVYKSIASYATFTSPATLSGYSAVTATISVVLSGDEVDTFEVMSPRILEIESGSGSALVEVDTYEVVSPRILEIVSGSGSALEEYDIYQVDAPSTLEVGYSGQTVEISPPAYHNPRSAVAPVDKAIGIGIAENFTTEGTFAANGGTLGGTNPPTLDRGAVFDGDGVAEIPVDYAPLGVFAVTLRARFDAAPTGCILAGSADHRSGVSDPGFCIWADSTGVRAGVRDSGGNLAELVSDQPITVGSEYVITLTVEAGGGVTLLVGDAVNTGSIPGYIADEWAAGVISFGVDFVGRLCRFRAYRGGITLADHLCGYTPASAPALEYRCQAFGDDSTRGAVWAVQGAEYDVLRGDGVSGMPVFADPGYTFDGVDQYLGGWPGLGLAEYTVCAVVDTGSGIEFVSGYDSTLIDELTTPGGFTGTLYRIGVWAGELSPWQILNLKFEWVRKHGLLGAEGIDRRLIDESAVVLLHRYSDGDANGIGGTGADGTPTDVVFTEDGGVFGDPTSQVVVADNGGFAEGSIAIVAAVNGDRELISKGLNFDLTLVGGDLFFTGVWIPLPGGFDPTATHQYAVTFREGRYAELYVDGDLVGTGFSPLTGVAEDTADYTIGAAEIAPGTATIDVVMVTNVRLTSEEVKAAYFRARGMV